MPKTTQKRREIFTLGAALPAFLMAAPMQREKLPDTIYSDTEAKLIKEPFGDLRIYFDGPTDQLKLMTAGSLRLKAGQSPHPPHTHPEEEFMVVTEGTGEMTVEGKVYKVGPGSMMYCAGNKSHGILNTGKKPLLFYFYKWKA